MVYMSILLFHQLRIHHKDPHLIDHHYKRIEMKGFTLHLHRQLDQIIGSIVIIIRHHHHRRILPPLEQYRLLNLVTLGRVGIAP